MNKLTRNPFGQTKIDPFWLSRIGTNEFTALMAEKIANIEEHLSQPTYLISFDRIKQAQLYAGLTLYLPDGWWRLDAVNFVAYSFYETAAFKVRLHGNRGYTNLGWAGLVRGAETNWWHSQDITAGYTQSCHTYLPGVPAHVRTTIAANPTITNPNFTSDTTGWTAVNATLSSEAGGQAGNCLKVLNNGAVNGYAYQAITTVPGQSYTLKGYQKEGTSDIPGKVLVGTTQGGSELGSADPTNASWLQWTVTFTATTRTTYIALQCNGVNLTDFTLFDTLTITVVQQESVVGYIPPMIWKGYRWQGDWQGELNQSIEPADLTMRDQVRLDADALDSYSEITTVRLLFSRLA